MASTSYEHAFPTDYPEEIDLGEQSEASGTGSEPEEMPMSAVERVQLNSFFDRGFLAYSFSSANALFDKKMFSDPKTLEGDQIVLPANCLDLLTRFRATSPYQFQAKNGTRSLYCNVLEFTANEHTAYLPDWMMSRLDLVDGDRVTMVNASLPTCTRVQFQARKEFLETHNPKVIVQQHLRYRTILSIGQMIHFEYVGEHYTLTVIALEPADHVSLIDSNIDFSVVPLDE